MVEGRISAGVVVGDGTRRRRRRVDHGHAVGRRHRGRSASARDCLIGANAGVGISLGDGCVVEAGLYVTAGAKVLAARRTRSSRRASCPARTGSSSGATARRARSRRARGATRSRSTASCTRTDAHRATCRDDALRGGALPGGSSTTNDAQPGKRWFCQFDACRAASGWRRSACRQRARRRRASGMLGPQARTSACGWWNQIVSGGCRRRIRSRAMRVSGSENGRGAGVLARRAGRRASRTGSCGSGRRRARSCACRARSRPGSGSGRARGRPAARLGVVEGGARRERGASFPWMHPTTRRAGRSPMRRAEQPTRRACRRSSGATEAHRAAPGPHAVTPDRREGDGGVRPRARHRHAARGLHRPAVQRPEGNLMQARLRLSRGSSCYGRVGAGARDDRRPEASGRGGRSRARARARARRCRSPAPRR